MHSNNRNDTCLSTQTTQNEIKQTYAHIYIYIYMERERE